MIRKKKGIKALALGLVIAIMSSSFAFADTSAIPMSLTIKEKAIDVSVTEKLSMSASAGKTVMEVGNITVTNNAAGNSLYLYSAAYGGDVSEREFLLCMGVPEENIVITEMKGVVSRRKAKVKLYGVTYEQKDEIKALGYRWDRERKIWYKRIEGEEISPEEREKILSIGEIKIKVLR